VRPSLRLPEPAGRRAVARFADRVVELADARTLARWLLWLQAFLRDDPWSMQRRMEDIPSSR